MITPAVERLRDGLGYPGMAILQYALRPRRPHSPHNLANHREHQVVYTGTHDHDTLRGWYDSLPADGARDGRRARSGRATRARTGG